MSRNTVRNIVALVTGLLAGVLPAVTAMRLSVVDALRRV